MPRVAIVRSAFVAASTILTLAGALPAAAGNASGTIGRGVTTVKVVDAVAWKGIGFFSEEPVIKVALAGSAFDHKALAAALDIERAVEMQLADKGDTATLEFEPNGAWPGGGSYSFRNNGCGFCQDGAQSAGAKLRVEGGALKGTIKTRAADTEEGDGTESDLTLDLPILEPTGVTKLPADGGEPGKALRACQQAVKGADKAAFMAACFAADDPDTANTNLDYFETVAALADSLSWGRRGIFLEQSKITGGRMKGDQAEIDIEGKLVTRSEGEPDSIEVRKGRVFLARGASGWRFAGEDLDTVY